MSLFNNPFYTLGATTRDTKKRIMELAQEKSLVLDPEVVAEARQILTNPKKRIKAEISWFPGMDTQKLNEICEDIKYGDFNWEEYNKLSTMIRFNVFSELFCTTFDQEINIVIKGRGLFAITYEYDAIDIEELISMINEDRTVAEFPEIIDYNTFREELQNYKDEVVQRTQTTLRKLSRKDLTRILLVILEDEISTKRHHSMIETLIDKFYSIEVQKELDEFKSILNRKAQVLKSWFIRHDYEQTLEDDKLLKFYLDAYIDGLTKFDEIMQPLQLSLQHRGIEHKASKDIAYEARDVAIALFNHRHASGLSVKLFKKLKGLFVEIDSFSEKIEVDLSEIGVTNNEISCFYEEIGGIVLSIDSTDIRISSKFESEILKIEDITKIRYGYEKYEFSTRTLVAFGKRFTSHVFEWLKYDDWMKFVNCLWNAVGNRIVMAMAYELALGKNIYGVVFDDKVKLSKKNIFKTYKSKFYKWTDVCINSSEHDFIICSNDNSGYTLSLSYKHDYNTYVIESLLKQFYLNKNRNSISQSLGITTGIAMRNRSIDFSYTGGYIYNWISGYFQ